MFGDHSSDIDGFYASGHARCSARTQRIWDTEIRWASEDVPELSSTGLRIRNVDRTQEWTYRAETELRRQT